MKAATDKDDVTEKETTDTDDNDVIDCRGDSCI